MATVNDSVMADNTSNDEMRDDDNNNAFESLDNTPTSTAAPVDAVLESLLTAARELGNNSKINVSTIRSLILKVLTEADLFAGYDQIQAALRLHQEDASAEMKRLRNTLNLFSYGTIGDYLQDKSNNNDVNDKDKHQYLTLSDAQLFKLRQLTVLTLAQRACESKRRRLDYSHLKEALFLSNNNNNNNENDAVRAVEEVLISCVYARVITGQLCQKSKAFLITTNNTNASTTAANTGTGGSGNSAVDAETPTAASTAAATASSSSTHKHSCISSRDVPTEHVSAMLDTVRQLQDKIRESRQMLQHQNSLLQQKAAAEKEQLVRAKEYMKMAKAKTAGVVMVGNNTNNNNSLSMMEPSSSSVAHATAVATGQVPPPPLDSATAASFSYAAGGSSSARRQKRSRGGGLSGMGTGGGSGGGSGGSDAAGASYFETHAV